MTPNPETFAAVSYSIVAAKTAIDLISKDIYALTKDKTAAFVRRVHACLNTSTVCDNLKNVRKVKTIYHLDKDIDIRFFYYSSRLLVGKTRKVVNNLADIPFEGNLIIEGTVGQGKSTFLRYLTWSEATVGNLIPLFVELRRYDGSVDLFSYLLGQLKSFGMVIDAEVFAFLLETGKVALFLDGFDEIGDKSRSALVVALDDVARQFPSTRMIVTSRPDSDIQSSEWFRVVQLAPLVDKEYQEVIRRMVGNSLQADRLIDLIESAALMQLAFTKTSIEALLTTPLMVALLIVKFNIEHAVPKNLCEFYKELFLVLLQRHDRSKAGFRRERGSKLSDDNLQAVFDALCFRMRSDGISTLARPQMRLLLKTICEEESIDADQQAIIDDISKITCLLVDEGGEFRFVHRSVQEFHAARYIFSQPDVNAETFYKTVREKWHAWNEEINFLSELDAFRFIRYFEINDIRHLLAALSAAPTYIRGDDELSQFTGELVAECNGSGAAISRWVRVGPQPTWSGYKALCRCWTPLSRSIAKSLASTVLATKEAQTAPWYREIVRPFIGGSTKLKIRIYHINVLFKSGKIPLLAIKSLEDEAGKVALRLDQLESLVETKLRKKTKFDFSDGKKTK